MLGLDVIEHFSKHDRGGGPCVRKNLKDFLYNRVNFFPPLSEVFITFLLRTIQHWVHVLNTYP